MAPDSQKKFLGLSLDMYLQKRFGALEQVRRNTLHQGAILASSAGCKQCHQEKDSLLQKDGGTHLQMRLAV